MDPLHISLVLSILFCSLVAGILFAFAVIVMPGIAKLTDKEYLFAFKHMDGIIQENHPLFILVWSGSILSVIITFVLGVMILTNSQIYLLTFAATLYLIGVQLPTFRINIPLNNSLQDLDIEGLGAAEATLFRSDFERTWNLWNRVRTVNAVITVLALLLFLLRL